MPPSPLVASQRVRFPVASPAFSCRTEGVTISAIRPGDRVEMICDGRAIVFDRATGTEGRASTATVDRVEATGLAARIAQAMCVAAAQADCSLDEALVLITDRARFFHMTLDAMTASVVDGSNRFY
jgi:hypothetical protein